MTNFFFFFFHMELQKYVTAMGYQGCTRRGLVVTNEYVLVRDFQISWDLGETNKK